MLRPGFEQLGLHLVHGRCDARNTASAELMERLGLPEEAHFAEAEIFKGERGDEPHWAMLDRGWRNSPHSPRG